MFCRYCGREIADAAVICPHCGVATDNFKPQTEQKNVLALIGFILSFVSAVGGLVCSIIAYKKLPEYNGNGKGFAIAGIIISAAELASSVIAIIYYIIFLVAYLPLFINYLPA